MITEDYVNKQIALLLREKGFDEPTLYHYNGDNKEPTHTINYDLLKNSELKEFCSAAPTLQMVLKWLREVHQIGIFPRQYHIYKKNCDEFGYGIEIIKLKTDTPLNPSRENMSDKNRYFISSSYEKACEAAIKYILENLI